MGRGWLAIVGLRVWVGRFGWGWGRLGAWLANLRGLWVVQERRRRDLWSWCSWGGIVGGVGDVVKREKMRGYFARVRGQKACQVIRGSARL
jgi:hypothetical protein